MAKYCTNCGKELKEGADICLNCGKLINHDNETKKQEPLPTAKSKIAAGAMIYVVIQELIPESQTNENKEVISMCTLIGFTIMMLLDVLLG